ncbi:hypothetical protein H8N03_15515 [Ramlibacter sp. USB13]|uniref:Uncharacterized protein n=1 Tax=Ramlibacter cellulosilyticus TaxID=2764187 RepID=A0A923SBX4_9BURK|nr:hypothetical protein [Ramlibacter cellulosilyticus]MBC5784361.1 hypothetical protein [Ramlibacter cellulosilyticus]
MNHQEIDASLRAAEPARESLADGFSPPADAQPAPAGEHGRIDPPEPVLSPKSPF